MRYFSSVSRFAGVAIALVTIAPSLFADVIAITFPGSGTTVNIGTLVIAEVDPGVTRDSIQTVLFQYSADAATWIDIPGACPLGIAEFCILWNPASFGNQYVRAVMVQTDGSTTVSTPVLVFVNQQPVPVAIASATSKLYNVEYDASGSYDPDGTIASYAWNFGDGSTGIGSIVQHQFAGPGSYGVSLTVTDDRGGSITRNSLLAITGQGYLKDKSLIASDCGCEKMNLKVDGNVDPNSFQFNGLGITPAESQKLGAYNDAEPGDQLDFTNQNSYTVRYRFEVIAQLKPFSQPQLCEEGQRVQSTTTDSEGKNKKWHGARTSDPRYDYLTHKTKPGDLLYNPDDPFDPNDDPNSVELTDCGYGDPTWCDDDYHGGGGPRGNGSGNNPPPNGYKKYDGQQRIVWVDAPGIKGLSKDRLQKVGYSDHNKFEAIVSGPGGKDLCKCTWEVNIEIDKTGKVTKNKLENLQCTP